jgi:hemophore-related protein
MPTLTRLGVVACGAVLALTAGAGIAAAQPDLNKIINSTCTYPQVMAALNAQSPDAANQVNTNPIASAWLQQLVASPPDQRQVMVQQAQTMPALQEYSGLISSVASSCNNY